MEVMRKLIATMLMALAIFSCDANAQGREESGIGGARLCEREMMSAAREFQVPISVLYAVGLTETGRKESLQPFALNIEGTAFFGRDLGDALARFSKARMSGIKLIDVGCMQINHYFHSGHFDSLESMFDPRKNVRYAAQFLKQLRLQEGNWTLAVARYNAGPNNDPAQKRYICAVIAHMVASGFGNWTLPAREFCQKPDKPGARTLTPNEMTNPAGEKS